LVKQTDRSMVFDHASLDEKSIRDDV